LYAYPNGRLLAYWENRPVSASEPSKKGRNGFLFPLRDVIGERGYFLLFSRIAERPLFVQRQKTPPPKKPATTRKSSHHIFSMMMSPPWNEIFGISLPGEQEDSVMVDVFENHGGPAADAHGSSSIGNTRTKEFGNVTIMTVSMYPKYGESINNKKKKGLFKFDLSLSTDQISTERYIEGFRSIDNKCISVQVDWNASTFATNVGHHIFQVLDCLMTLTLWTDLKVSCCHSVQAATRVASILRNNPYLSCFELGYHQWENPEMAEGAKILGRAIAENTSLKEFRYLPFSSTSIYSTTDSTIIHDRRVDQAIRPIMYGVKENTSLTRLHLWAPGVIPAYLIEATILGHPSITELSLDGATPPYQGKSGDRYQSFQHVIWKVLYSRSCRLKKLELHDFELTTPVVDTYLSSLWKGHPLEVLDVSGNLLYSLNFPRFLRQQSRDEMEGNLRLLVIERQWNAFASMEYDLTYPSDETRCRQHCHDMMKLVSARPGLSIQHAKIPAMLQKTTILPTILPPPSLSQPPIRFTSTDQLLWLLDRHRVIPSQIGTIHENICPALWPLILGRCTRLLKDPDHPKGDDAVSRRRQASVLYQLFQDCHCLILVQREGRQEHTREKDMVTMSTV